MEGLGFRVKGGFRVSGLGCEGFRRGLKGIYKRYQAKAFGG